MLGSASSTASVGRGYEQSSGKPQAEVTLDLKIQLALFGENCLV